MIYAAKKKKPREWHLLTDIWSGSTNCGLTVWRKDWRLQERIPHDGYTCPSCIKQETETPKASVGTSEPTHN